MRAQPQIQRRLGAAEALDRIAGILAAERFANRRALGRRVGEEFDYRDARGRSQLAGCRKALDVLAGRHERIVLPPPAGGVQRGGRPALLAAEVQLAETVPERLELVRELSIEPVGERSQRRIWNTHSDPDTLSLTNASESGKSGGTEYVSRSCSGLRGLGNDLFYPAAMGGYAALVFAANRFRACARS